MNTRADRTISWEAAVVLLAIASASECAHAQQSPQELTFRASATATYSDNAARTATGESATALDGLIGLRLVHQSPMLFADADVSAVLRDYLEGNLPSQTLPNGHLSLLAGPTAGVLNWTVTDSFGQIGSEPFAALFAQNRQNINVLSTGPNLRIQLDNQDHLDVSGRYGRDTFGDSNLNDQSWTGRAMLAHDLGSVSQLGLVYAYQRIDFRLNTLGTVPIEKTYAKYALAGARTYVVLEAGADRLEGRAASSSRTGHVLALLQRHLTERITFEGAYQHGYTDAAGAFVSASRDNFTAGSDQTVQAVALPFEESQGYAQLTRSAGRLRAAIQATASHESYPGQPASERRTRGANLAGDYQVTSEVSLTVTAGYYHQSFPVTLEENRWVEGSVGISRKLGRSLELSLAATRTKGTSSLLTGNFTENRAVLRLAYAPDAERLQRIYDTSAQFRYYDRPIQPGQAQPR